MELVENNDTGDAGLGLLAGGEFRAGFALPLERSLGLLAFG